MNLSSPGRRLPLVLCLALLAVAGCASAIKPFKLTVERLAVKKINITGMAMDVDFVVRNPNPDALRIERFEYDLKLNGQRLGTGYHADAIDLAGFGEAKVTSRFDLGFLQIPGTVKAILDGHRAEAAVQGTFYVDRNGGLRKVPFRSTADVPIGH
jgi:LEA14-like dessication related protein